MDENQNLSGPLLVLIEEYRWRYSEILKYIDSANSFSNYQLLIIGALITALSTILGQDHPNHIIVFYLVLLTPVPLNLLAWSYEHCHFMMAANAKYIFRVLRPRVCRETKNRTLLDWENFLQNDTIPFKTQSRVWRTMTYNIPTYIAVIASITCVVATIFYTVFTPELMTTINILLGAFLILVAILFSTITLKNHVATQKYFKSISSG